MNLNKMFVFIFVFLVVSGILLATMCPEFVQLGITASYEDKEVVEYFNAQNVLTYNETHLGNLTYPCEEQVEWGLPEDEKLEFWWNEEWYYGEGDVKMLEVRHLIKHWTGWWWTWHELKVQEPYATLVWDPELGLRRSDLMKLWNEDYNASYCEFACDHLNVKLFIVTANQSWTLLESWDNDEIRVFSSYDVDWENTGYSMWTVMSRLLNFQNPNLGIPGVGGQILSVGVGAALWACIAILFFALITAIIPFIPGWKGG